MTRVGLVNASVVSHSTRMRAPRAAAAQMVAGAAVTSPLATPRVMTGGLVPMPKGWKLRQPNVEVAARAAAVVVRKVRREGVGMAGDDKRPRWVWTNPD